MKKNAIARYPERASLYFEQYFHSYQSLSRFFVLLHPLAPASLLKKHFRSSSWLERYAIAKNPNTPPHIRENLTQDAIATNPQSPENILSQILNNSSLVQAIEAVSLPQEFVLEG
jgi:hypothetical protein